MKTRKPVKTLLLKSKQGEKNYMDKVLVVRRGMVSRFKGTFQNGTDRNYKL